MIPRTAEAAIRRYARGFPVVALTGPRQSGKTTLARAVFADRPYVSLEAPDAREFAQRDPRGFLARFDEGAVIDEAQRCPDLFSYLQGVVDERRRMGDFVLTGSQQFGLLTRVTQSLAGRVGLVQLLPFSLAELAQAGRRPPTLDQALFVGGYPPLHDRDLDPDAWFANYVATYLERDVRQLLAVRDLTAFQRFVRMCAARTGQVLNLSALAADCSISHVTARQWLTVLEASYIVRLLPPFHRNFGKRLVKSPKLYFLDCGLAAWLLGIRESAALATHAQRGALFETLVHAECVKHALNQGRAPDLHFWRDQAGHEVDLVFEVAGRLQGVELKSGATFVGEWAQSLQRWRLAAQEAAPEATLVYGGGDSYRREGLRVLAWHDAAQAMVPAP